MFVSATSLAFPQAAYQAQARAGAMPEAAPKQALPALAAALSADGATVADSQQVEAARQWTNTEVASFAAEVGKKFREEGIRMSPEPMLAVGSDGQVTVVNNHPDRQQIERLFANDSQLTQRFAAVAATAETVQTADNQKDFADQYQALSSDPKAQKALVAQAASSSGSLRFHLVLTPHGPEYFFPGVLRASA
ncbi:MAG TPA: hypothetical protein VFK74_05335 [Azospira sp.]|nr:hypothetical protein [Azospira sp.]